MTKAVLESGLLQDIEGQYEITGPLSGLAIPTTLQDSLMARLDRLVTAKAVAQYAAVIGRQFSYDLLHAVSGYPRNAGQFGVGHVLYGTKFNHEFSHPAEDRPTWDFGRKVFRFST